MAVDLDEVPWHELETIFFDAGNTLVSIDFDWVSRELLQRGITCDASELRRAEAAARPKLSAWIASEASTESQETFEFYLGVVLEKLAAARAAGAARIAELAVELAPVLRSPGRARHLWSWVLPGVREALASMADAGLELAVVSNSDGSIESGLDELGLRSHFSAVFDSQLVGYEKPDPRIFEKALEVCGADPARTLHVGDLYAADVVGARKAGVHPLLLDPFDDWVDVDCPRLPDLASLGERLLIGAEVQGGKVRRLPRKPTHSGSAR
jgi:putative hydrolase of the HAD superfamily